jgi:hypothetical protein
MPDRIIEETHLVKARVHLVAATARIANQCLIIGKLRACGLDTRQAEACLRTMQTTLTAMQGHKELIEEMLATLPAAKHLPRWIPAESPERKSVGRS